jgi:hypothetical protein
LDAAAAASKCSLLHRGLPAVLPAAQLL